MTLAEEPRITDWMQAWGSVAGVAVGILASALTGGLLLYEIRTGRRAQREAAEDRAEAAADRALVAAERRDAALMQARTVVPSEMEVDLREDGFIALVRLEVSNFGPGPVLDLEVFVMIENESVRARGELSSRAVLGPGQTLTIDGPIRPAIDTAKILGELLPPAELLEVLHTELRYTDMVGARWRRRHNKQPERVFEEETSRAEASS